MAELNRWKYRVVSALGFNTSDALGVANALGDIAAMNHPPAFLDDFAAALPNVTAADVQKVMASLKPELAQIVVDGDAAVLKPALEKAGILPSEPIMEPKPLNVAAK